jgi:hypothetical protein
MELVHPAVLLRLSRYLSVTLGRVHAACARTRWLHSPDTLSPNQTVSPMSDEWMHEFERFEAAHGADSA